MKYIILYTPKISLKGNGFTRCFILIKKTRLKYYLNFLKILKAFQYFTNYKGIFSGQL